MEVADIETELSHPEYPEVKAGIVKWPMSVIRLKSKAADKLIELGREIFNIWKNYDDRTRNIRAYSQKKGKEVRHNTVTPIARRKKDKYELDLVLRNNRRSKEHPAGIFHPHEELHHIKKENIGLIEVMGLAVLPGRLKEELRKIEKYLIGEKEFSGEEDLEEKLIKHSDWIKKIIDKYGTNLGREEARQRLKEEVGNKFKKVLEDAGVFKRSKNGKKGFKEFLQQAGLK